MRTSISILFFGAFLSGSTQARLDQITNDFSTPCPEGTGKIPPGLSDEVLQEVCNKIIANPCEDFTQPGAGNFGSFTNAYQKTETCSVERNSPSSEGECEGIYGQVIGLNAAPGTLAVQADVLDENGSTLAVIATGGGCLPTP